MMYSKSNSLMVPANKFIVIQISITLTPRSTSYGFKTVNSTINVTKVDTLKIANATICNSIYLVLNANY